MRAVRRETGWSTCVAVTLFVILATTWVFIPPAAIRSAWLAERAAVYAMAGGGSEISVYSRAVDDQQLLAPDFRRLIADAGLTGQGPLGDTGLGHWAQDRLLATWWWLGLSTYRLQVLMGWLLPGIPLAMAAYQDGQLVREIRKYAFVAQSPIRHSLGVRVLWIVLMGLVGWLIVPVPVPSFVAPLLIVAIAYALWLWVSNLQKRL